MQTPEKTIVTVNTTINAPLEKVWKIWTDPEHIRHWNSASPDWHTTKAENDLREGGKFSSRMEAKDGSMGFDFEGIYDQIIPDTLIAYTLGDDRKVRIEFAAKEDQTSVTESFEAESTHPVEFQKAGWQAIMDNFKAYTENIR